MVLEGLSFPVAFVVTVPSTSRAFGTALVLRTRAPESRVLHCNVRSSDREGGRDDSIASFCNEAVQHAATASADRELHLLYGLAYTMHNLHTLVSRHVHAHERMHILHIHACIHHKQVTLEHVNKHVMHSHAYIHACMACMHACRYDHLATVRGFSCFQRGH